MPFAGTEEGPPGLARSCNVCHHSRTCHSWPRRNTYLATPMPYGNDGSFGDTTAPKGRAYDSLVITNLVGSTARNRVGSRWPLIGLGSDLPIANLGNVGNRRGPISAPKSHFLGLHTPSTVACSATTQLAERVQGASPFILLVKVIQRG